MNENVKEREMRQTKGDSDVSEEAYWERNLGEDFWLEDTEELYPVEADEILWKFNYSSDIDEGQEVEVSGKSEVGYVEDRNKEFLQGSQKMGQQLNKLGVVGLEQTKLKEDDLLKFGEEDKGHLDKGEVERSDIWDNLELVFYTKHRLESISEEEEEEENSYLDYLVELIEMEEQGEMLDNVDSKSYLDKVRDLDSGEEGSLESFYKDFRMCTDIADGCLGVGKTKKDTRLKKTLDGDQDKCIRLREVSDGLIMDQDNYIGLRREQIRFREGDKDFKLWKPPEGLKRWQDQDIRLWKPPECYGI